MRKLDLVVYGHAVRWKLIRRLFAKNVLILSVLREPSQAIVYQALVRAVINLIKGDLSSVVYVLVV